MDVASKWETGMKLKAIPAWQEYAKAPKTDVWAKGLGEAFDVTVGPMTKRLYEEGLKATTPEEYEKAIEGKGQKLVDKVRKAIAR